MPIWIGIDAAVVVHRATGIVDSRRILLDRAARDVPKAIAAFIGELRNSNGVAGRAPEALLTELPDSALIRALPATRAVLWSIPDRCQTLDPSRIVD